MSQHYTQNIKPHQRDLALQDKKVGNTHGNDYTLEGNDFNLHLFFAAITSCAFLSKAKNVSLWRLAYKIHI